MWTTQHVGCLHHRWFSKFPFEVLGWFRAFANIGPGVLWCVVHEQWGWPLPICTPHNLTTPLAPPSGHALASCIDSKCLYYTSTTHGQYHKYMYCKPLTQRSDVTTCVWLHLATFVLLAYTGVFWAGQVEARCEFGLELFLYAQGV